MWQALLVSKESFNLLSTAKWQQWEWILKYIGKLFLLGEVVIEFVQDQEHNRVELLVLILSSFL